MNIDIENIIKKLDSIINIISNITIDNISMVEILALQELKLLRTDLNYNLPKPQIMNHKTRSKWTAYPRTY